MCILFLKCDALSRLPVHEAPNVPSLGEILPECAYSGCSSDGITCAVMTIMNQTCDCGCGQFPKTPGKRYLRGHERRHHFAQLTPARHPRRQWDGDKTKFQHVIIAERALGRSLPQGAVVHHVDCDRWNNANTNLVICQDQKYHMLLHVRMRVVMAGGNPNTQKVCSTCKQPQDFATFYTNKSNSDGYHDACRECHKAAMRVASAERRAL